MGQGSWTAEGVEKLLAVTTLPITKLTDYMQCYYAEKDDPLKPGEPEPAPAALGTVHINPNQGLQSYTLHPPHMKGRADLHFAHIVRMRNRTSQPKVRPLSDLWDSPLITALDLVVTDDNRAVIEPTAQELQEGYIIREVGVAAASRKMPKRRLNVIGEVNSHSVHANAPGRIKRLKVVAELAAALQGVKESRAEQRAADAVKRQAAVKEFAAPGMRKLEAGMGLSKLTAQFTI